MRCPKCGKDNYDWVRLCQCGYTYPALPPHLPPQEPRSEPQRSIKERVRDATALRATFSEMGMTDDKIDSLLEVLLEKNTEEALLATIETAKELEKANRAEEERKRAEEKRLSEEGNTNELISLAIVSLLYQCVLGIAVNIQSWNEWEVWKIWFSVTKIFLPISIIATIGLVYWIVPFIRSTLKSIRGIYQ